MRTRVSGFGMKVELLCLQRARVKERFVRSIKEECLGRMVFFGESSLRRALADFVEHYHGERPHQGLGNELIEARSERARSTGKVISRDRLGGLLRHYRRAA